MNGILCINKPEDYTSFDVVARIRGMSKTKKVGHSGTLDPMATGVLPIFIGTAAKACDMTPNGDKTYIAEFELGVTTDTLDRTGKELSRVKSEIKAEEIIAALPSFRGEIDQLPPMYSAVKVNGRRLYDLARRGVEIERKSRRITIYSLELLSFDEKTQRGRLEMSCSKGAYVRSVISDLGEKLQTGGIMTALVRTAACGFALDDCLTLEQAQELADGGALESRLLPIDALFSDYPRIKLNAAQSDKFKNGVILDLNRINYDGAFGLHRVYGSDGAFLGLASADTENAALRLEKMFYRA